MFDSYSIVIVSGSLQVESLTWTPQLVYWSKKNDDSFHLLIFYLHSMISHEAVFVQEVVSGPERKTDRAEAGVQNISSQMNWFMEKVVRIKKSLPKAGQYRSLASPNIHNIISEERGISFLPSSRRLNQWTDSSRKRVIEQVKADDGRFMSLAESHREFG